MYLLGKRLVASKSNTVFLKQSGIFVKLPTVQPYNGIHIFKLPFGPFVESAVNYGIIIPGINEQHLVPVFLGFCLIKEPEGARQGFCIEEVVADTDHDIHMTCFYEALADIFIFSLAVRCGGRHNKARTTPLIQIAVEIGNPKIVSVSDFLILVDARHTEGQSLGTLAGFRFYLIYIKRRICHDIIAAPVQVVGIVIEGVCLIARLDNTCQAVNRHIHQAKLGIVLHFLLPVEGHRTVGIHTGLIDKIS